MKILHVCSWYQPIGGAERMLFSILDGLEAFPIGDTGQSIGDFVQNIIVTQEASGQRKDKRVKYFIKNLQYDFGDCRPLKAWFDNRKVARRLQEIIQRELPDVIHNHNVLNPFVNRTLQKSGVPVVFHVHDPRLFCFTHWKLKPNVGRLGQKSSARFMKNPDDPDWVTGAKRLSHIMNKAYSLGEIIEDRPICDDSIGRSCIKSGCLRLGRMNPERRGFPFFFWNWQIVRKSDFNFIFPGMFQGKMLRENGFHGCNFAHLPNFTDEIYSGKFKRREDTILFVGRASYEKGIMFLLEALAMIPRSVKWRLILCASGPQIGQVRKRIKELRLVRRTTIIHSFSRRRIATLYEKATFVVMPSVWHETFGLVGIEAFAHKCPVIAFDVGGIREWWKSGALIPPKNIKALSESIVEILKSSKNPEWREVVERETSTEVQQKFSLKQYIPGLLNIYSSLCK